MALPKEWTTPDSPPNSPSALFVPTDLNEVIVVVNGGEEVVKESLPMLDESNPNATIEKFWHERGLLEHIPSDSQSQRDTWIAKRLLPTGDSLKAVRRSNKALAEVIIVDHTPTQ